VYDFLAIYFPLLRYYTWTRFRGAGQDSISFHIPISSNPQTLCEVKKPGGLLKMINVLQ